MDIITSGREGYGEGLPERCRSVMPWRSSIAYRLRRPMGCCDGTNRPPATAAAGGYIGSRSHRFGGDVQKIVGPPCRCEGARPTGSGERRSWYDMRS